MKLQVKAKPALLDIASSIDVRGTLLDLPRSDFADFENPLTAFRRLLNGHCPVEDGHPVEIRSGILHNIHRWRTIEMSNVCGYLIDGEVMVTEDRVRAAATFIPSGPKMAGAVMMCLNLDEICLSSRKSLNGDNKIVQIETWDLVVELAPVESEKVFILKRD